MFGNGKISVEEKAQLNKTEISCVSLNNSERQRYTHF